MKTIEKIYRFQTKEEDEEKMTWDAAMEKFDGTGEGWRLPTPEELRLIYERRDEIGGFKDSWYWCSHGENSLAMFLIFGNGFNGWDYKDCSGSVRCIRDV